MCGIFGYIGERENAANIVLNGLKTLEYRGYDSWGIALAKGESLQIDKHVGKIGKAKTTLGAGSLAIGHTRWATHGGVTKKNAHPHLDCQKKVAVIHNGIIENFQDLKKELEKKKHKFVSETDTEVVAHLVEEKLKTKNFKDAVRSAFNELTGMNAVVAINADSSEIIAVKNGSPLVVGKKNNESYLASDATGILPYTQNILFIEDGQMVVFNKASLKLYDLSSGKKIKPKIEKLAWEIKESSLGKYKHFFIKEIHEEPKVIKNIAYHGLAPAKKLASLIKKARGTFLIACGSASYAAISATYLFSKIAKKHVNFTVGSEFKYMEDFANSQTLVVPISQSGESIDVIEPVSKLKKKGVYVASVVNVFGSTLQRMSDFSYLLEAGPEKAVVATKSFSAMVSALILTAYAMTGKAKQGQKILLKAGLSIAKILKVNYLKKIKTLASKLKNKEHIYVIGRGLAYAAALEATLKIKEAAYVHAEAFPGGELKHGVIALVDKGTPIIVFAPNDETYEEIVSNAEEIKARGGYIIGIGTKDNDVFDYFLKVEDVTEGTILPQVAIAHLLGYYLALAKGNKDPDKPRNLAKSVTVK